MYKFNLQLFNDGATEEDSVEEVQSEPTKVGLDENGNVGFIYDESEPDKEKSEEVKTEPAEGTQKTEQTDEQDFYSPEEVRTTDFEKLDPNKIPADMLPWYKSMQAGFTRKTQEIAEKNRELDAILEKARQIPQPEQRTQVSPEQYFEQRHNFLRSQVAEMFKSDLEDDMQYWTPAQRLAYDQLNRQLTDNDLRKQSEQQDKERKHKEATTFLDSLESELRTADPAAYDYAIQRLKDGEVLEKDKLAIAKALQTGDSETVKKYFDGFRKEFHGEKAGVVKESKPVIPPKTESPGNNSKPEVKGPPDYSELARIKSFDEKLQWMRKHGIQP